MEACSLLVNLRKGMKGSSKQPLVGQEHCVTTLITAAKETTYDNGVWKLDPGHIGGRRLLSPLLSKTIGRLLNSKLLNDLSHLQV